MKGELELPCCYRSRPFYTKSQGQGVSSCLERSGAPPGISRQAPAKMGGYQAVWARLWKGQRSGAPPGISRQAPAKMGGSQALWAHPWQGAKVRCASSILRQAPAGGGGGGGARPIGNVLGIWQHPSPPQNWYKNGGSLLWSSVHQFSSKALVKRMDSSLSIFSPPLFPCLFSFFPCLFDLFCFASVSSSISFFFSVFIFFFFLLIMLILNSNFQFYK